MKIEKWRISITISRTNNPMFKVGDDITHLSLKECVLSELKDEFSSIRIQIVY